MTIANKRISSFDIVLLVWLLFFVLVQFRFHLFEVQTRVAAGIISFAIYFVYLLGKFRKGICFRYVLALGALLVFVAFLNALVSPKTHLINNIIEICIPLFLILFFGRFISYPGATDSFFKKIIIPLNLYLIINSVVLYLQLNGATYLLDTTFYSDLSYDYYSGLLGGNDGTHRLTMLVSLLLILNIHYFKCFTFKVKLFNIVCFSIGFVATTVFSTMNDNIAYFVYVPIVFVVYNLIKTKSIGSFIKTFYKPFFVVLIFYIVISFLVRNNTSGFGKIVNRLNETIFSYNFLEPTHRSPDERTRLFLIAVECGGAFGAGLGSIKLLAEPTISTHFGMASIQSLVYLIGYIPFFAYVAFISMYYSRFSKRKLFDFLLLFIFVFVSAYFSQVLTIFNSSILFVFLLLFLGRNTVATERSHS